MSSPCRCPVRGQVHVAQLGWSEIEPGAEPGSQRLARGRPGIAQLSGPQSTESSPGAQHPFASEENLANVNRASEPCLLLGPGHKLPRRGCRAWWRPVGGPRRGPGSQPSTQNHLQLCCPPLCHPGRPSFFLSPFPLGPVGVMRFVLLPFRVLMRIK